MKQMIVNRRRFLQLSGIGLSAATLAACVSPAPAVQTSKDAPAVAEVLPTSPPLSPLQRRQPS